MTNATCAPTITCDELNMPFWAKCYRCYFSFSHLF